MEGNDQELNAQKTLELLQKLEERVSRIEELLGLASPKRGKGVGASSTELSAADSQLEAEQTSLEFKIGAFWLARIGAILLLIGIAFFISYPIPGVSTLLTSLLGYAAVAVLFCLSRYWQKSFGQLSAILEGGSYFLLFFATLRLHFFSATPVISNKSLGLLFIVLVLSASSWRAIRGRKKPIVLLMLFLCYLAAIISETTHFALALITMTSFLTVFLLIKYDWLGISLISLIVAYMAHLTWLFNNPVMGNALRPVSSSGYNLAYLAVYGMAFALANAYKKDKTSGLAETLLALLNGSGIVLVGAVNVLAFYRPQASLFGLITFIYFMIIAIVNWQYKHKRLKYSSSYYACFGYVALSFAIFAQFNKPDYFLWLSSQSLIVIVTALWFRSRIIILANVLIFLGTLIAYLGFFPTHDLVNLSYAIAALASARILNWKKERLELKTDLIRNAYLASAFIIVLYGLFHAVPKQFVSFSWIMAALFYFGMSILLQNTKYRWMAILTVFASVIHVFIVDMSTVNAGFRIILFVVVGIVISLLSFVYTRFRKKLFGPARKPPGE